MFTTEKRNLHESYVLLSSTSKKLSDPNIQIYPKKIKYGHEVLVQILNLDTIFFIFLLVEPDFAPNLALSELFDLEKTGH